MGGSAYVDSIGSVSALTEAEDPQVYDPKHVELNGSTFLQLEMF